MAKETLIQRMKRQIAEDGIYRKHLRSVHKMCEAYGQRPCDVLFPDLKNPNIKISIDMIVYNMRSD